MLMVHGRKVRIWNQIFAIGAVSSIVEVVVVVVVDSTRSVVQLCIERVACKFV
jgi:hypothetical protein